VVSTTVSTIPYSEDRSGIDMSFLIFFEVLDSLPERVSVLPMIMSSPETRIAGQMIPSVSSLL